MPKYKAWWSLGEKIDLYAQQMRARGLSGKTIEGETWALRNMFRALWLEGFDVLPRRICQHQVDYLREIHYAGKSQSYVAHNLNILERFVRWAGNRQTGMIVWPRRGYSRPNATWLEDGDAMRLIEFAEGTERILVHCELDLGLRRVEVLRLKTSDFQRGKLDTIVVHGKGRGGPKDRTIPWHPDTALELDRYYQVRDKIVAKARATNPDAEDPGNLLVYERKGEIRAYRKSAVDNILNRLRARMGLEFSHHTLRRTCGRMMHRAESNIEEISQILGHTDSRTTRLYLGLNVEDMSNTMRRLAKYQKSVKIPEIGISDDSQGKDGPCGISVPNDAWLTPRNSVPRNPSPGSAIER